MTRILLSLLLATSLAAPAAAQQYVYPSNGQPKSAQAKDESACSKWAREKTGFDPANPPVYPQAEAAPVTGSGARAKGALVGAGIGAISGGDAGEGALAGAAVGGISRRIRNRRAADAENRAAANQMGAQNDAYWRARASCLTARGYSVR